MAVWPNNFRTASGWSPYRHTGVPDFARYKQATIGTLAPHTSGVVSRSSSVPDGYGPGGARVLAIRGGGLAAYLSPTATLSGSAALVSAATLDGEGSLAWGTPAAALSLQVALEGSGAINVTVPAAPLAAVLGLSGSANIGLVGAGALAMLVPLAGSAAMALDGSADLRGRLSLSGSWSPFTELSPQSLAAAVWGAAASANNEAGTMGELLNGAGGGSSPGAVASAVWETLRTSSLGVGGMGEALVELWRLMGLDPTRPLIVTPTTRTAAPEIAQTIATVGPATTVTRT